MLSVMPYIWITIYFSSIQQTCAPFPGMKHNVHQCSLMDDSQSLVSWVGQYQAALAAHSCMGLRKHGLTHWDPRSTGLANELIDLRTAQVYCDPIFFGQPGSVSKFPPFLWVKLWVGWVGRWYTEISRYFPASWINWVTLVTKIKLLYSLRF